VKWHDVLILIQIHECESDILVAETEFYNLLYKSHNDELMHLHMSDTHTHTHTHHENIIITSSLLWLDNLSGSMRPHCSDSAITLRHTTLSGKPVDEWPVHRRDLYLTTQTDIHPTTGFKTAIPESERLQTVSDRAVIGICIITAWTQTKDPERVVYWKLHG